uniref:WSC domain-containing protein n=1 Tax=Branchiostoma floridae TaxID=7739 RepID=C3ZI35_BRAFL|eukprot:XP_002591766.1 hypothetical protein BRAFLDRAFT_83540 [Branchiostoma floridae]
METLVLVLGVLSAGLSAAQDPPQKVYNASGVTYVGCFGHGQPQHEQVLDVQINPACTSSHRESCLTPPMCIESCQNSNTSFIYIGLKCPGLCYCDSVLRGVSQTDSVDGFQCNGMCEGDSELACGALDHMLVYQWSNIIPPPTTRLPPTTSPVTITYTVTSTASGFTTTPEPVPIATRRDNKPQGNNTGLVVGLTVGATVFLGIVVAVVYVCVRRHTATERAQYVDDHIPDDHQRSRTYQDTPDERGRPIPTPSPCDSSDAYLELGVSPNDQEYLCLESRDDTLSNDDQDYAKQPPNHCDVHNASSRHVDQDSLVYEDVIVPSDKSTDTMKTPFFDDHFPDDEQRSLTNQDVPGERSRPTPSPSSCDSDIYLKPGVHVDDREYACLNSHDNAPPVPNVSDRRTSYDESEDYVNQSMIQCYHVNTSETDNALSSNDADCVNQPLDQCYYVNASETDNALSSNDADCVNQPLDECYYANASETGYDRESQMYEDVIVPMRNRERGMNST